VGAGLVLIWLGYIYLSFSNILALGIGLPVIGAGIVLIAIGFTRGPHPRVSA
jgi:hypothetical protein